jgi:dihydrofolate reductase/thymidylate synthase
MISLIANVFYHKNKLVVGVNDDLVVKLPKDMKYFKRITSNVDASTIVMGRRTWFSIPSSQRPLENRFNIILTRNPELLAIKGNKNHKFMTFQEFRKWSIGKNDIFIIGGGEIYNTFLELPEDDTLKPSRLYITETSGLLDINKNDRLSTITCIPQEYKLISSTPKATEYSFEYSFLIYKFIPGLKSSENTYLDLLRDVMKNGKERSDRTRTGTRSVFGRQTSIDISNSIPILTTKKVPWKSCIEELLWFIRGDTDANILKSRGVNIWNDNATREFLDSRGLSYKEGVLGPSYGWQWS